MAAFLVVTSAFLPMSSALAQESDAPPVVENPVSQPLENAVAPALEPAPSIPPATSAEDGLPQQPDAATPPPNDVSGIMADPQLPHNLSPWGMFMAADWVVKAVMIGLVIASLVTWTVWLAKSIELAGAKVRLRSALRTILQARSLEEASQQLDQRAGPAGLLVRAAVEEMQASAASLAHVEPIGVKERVESRLVRLQVRAGRKIGMGTGTLATIGSTAPFVGLFGTVWGIMNSFIGISEAQTTNLAVVAPGIAEALLATALGLVAAIPAVVIYNIFARSTAAYRQVLGDAAAGVQRLVSRDLDSRRAPRGSTQPTAITVE